MRTLALAPLAALAALTACSDLLQPGEPVRMSIAMDFRALHVSADGRTSASVLDAVRLTATPAGGAARSWSLDAGDQTILTFDVTVPAGSNEFLAEVTSNNGSVLYRGSRTEDIRESGFSFTIDLDTVNAVLVATPDTIDLRNVQAAQLTIRNAGNLPLGWSITAESTNVVVVRANPARGTLPRGAVTIVNVTGSSNSGERTVTMRVGSDVGSIDVPVIVPPLSIRLAAVGIRSITRTGTISVVDSGNVRGSVDVEIDAFLPAGQTGARLRTSLGGSVACDSLLAQGDSRVVCTIDTAQFDANAAFAATGGNLQGRFANGAHALVVTMVDATGSAVASDRRTLVLNNLGFMLARVTGPPDCAPDGQGALWCAGDLTVDLAAIRFSSNPGDDVARVSVTATGGSDTVTISDAAGPFRATFAASPGRTGSIAGMEHADVALQVSTFTAAGQPGSGCVVTDGSPARNRDCAVAGGRVVLAAPLRIDNAAPVIQRFDITPASLGCAALACRVNGQFLFAVRSGFFSMIDRGVGFATAAFQAELAGQRIPVTSGNDLVERPAIDYRLVATVSDRLRNTATLYAGRIATAPVSDAGSAQLFGVDLTRPLLDITGIAHLSSNPQEPGWFLEYDDAGPGPSGFAATPARVQLKRVRPAGETCFLPDSTISLTAVACTTPTGAVNFVADDGRIDAPHRAVPGAGEGYWQLTAFVLDLAGNASTIDTRLTLLDATPPAITSINAPGALPGLAATAFAATLTDNLDLVRRTSSILYGAVDLVVGRDNLGAWGFADGMRTTASTTTTVQSFVRAIQGTNSANRAAGTVAEAAHFAIEARDAAGNAGNDSLAITNAVRAANGFAPIPPLAVIDAPVFNPPNTSHGAFIELQPSVTTLCNGTQCGTSPSTTNLAATMTGPSGTFANPFVRVEFYFRDPADSRWYLIGPALAAVSDNSVTGTRTWTYTRTWNVDGLLNAAGNPLAGTIQVVALGVHTSGSALRTTNSLRQLTVLAN